MTKEQQNLINKINEQEKQAETYLKRTLGCLMICGSFHRNEDSRIDRAQLFTILNCLDMLK